MEYVVIVNFINAFDTQRFRSEEPVTIGKDYNFKL